METRDSGGEDDFGGGCQHLGSIRSLGSDRGHSPVCVGSQAISPPKSLPLPFPQGCWPGKRSGCGKLLSRRHPSETPAGEGRRLRTSFRKRPPVHTMGRSEVGQGREQNVDGRRPRHLRTQPPGGLGRLGLAGEGSDRQAPGRAGAGQRKGPLGTRKPSLVGEQNPRARESEKWISPASWLHS